MFDSFESLKKYEHPNALRSYTSLFQNELDENIANKPKKEITNNK